MTEDDHVPYPNAVLHFPLAVIPEVIPPNMIHSEPAFLIENYITQTGIRRAHYNSLLASSPRLSDQLLDDLSAESLSLSILCNCQLNYFTRLATQSDGGGADNLSGILRTVDRIAQIAETPIKSALRWFR
jgi:hypothetical protein